MPCDWEKSLPFPANMTLASNPVHPATIETNLQLMQLLTEAPAIGVDAGYGVVTEVKLVQRWKAIERATVYLCQAVILQVAVEKNEKELTDKQHWLNAEEFPTRTGILAIRTHPSTYPCGYVHVWAFLGQVKDRNSRTKQRKWPEWAETAEICSTCK